MQPDQDVKYKEIDSKEAQTLWDLGCSIEWRFGPMSSWNLCRNAPGVRVDWARWYRQMLQDNSNPRMRVQVE